MHSEFLRNPLMENAGRTNLTDFTLTVPQGSLVIARITGGTITLTPNSNNQIVDRVDRKLDKKPIEFRITEPNKNETAIHITDGQSPVDESILTVDNQTTSCAIGKGTTIRKRDDLSARIFRTA